MNTHTAHICDPELINAYHDNELPSVDRARAADDLRQCEQCRQLLRELETVSDILGTHARQATEGMIPGAIETAVVDRIRKKRGSVFAGLLPRRMLVPAATFASLLVIGFALVQHTFFPLESGPSAIVDSFSGNVSSVMILETPESRQTIIWFSEASEPSGENGNEV